MDENLNRHRSNTLLDIIIVVAIVAVIGGATFASYMILRPTNQKSASTRQNSLLQNTSNNNQAKENDSATANIILKSVHKNIKVTDPNKILFSDFIAAKEKLKTFSSVITLKTDEELKTAAIAYYGNDTDDARHIIQAMRLQLLQMALRGYQGIHSAFPDQLAILISEWPAIVSYCTQHQSVCNGGALRVEEPPVIIDIYTDQTYVYTATADNFTVKYFMTGCDSTAYCQGDDNAFVNGENTMTKGSISTLVSTQ